MIQYIAGFFDADGSVCLTRCHRNETKSPQVAFHNNELVILEAIQKYLDMGGTISKKKAKKPTHKDSYDLKYTRTSALEVLKRMQPYMLHPVKMHKTLLLLNDYKKVTPRNGFYTEELKQLRRDFEDEFFKDF